MPGHHSAPARALDRFPGTRLLAVLLCLALVLGAQPVPRVHAANLLVTNLNDDGPGSLRQAIATAADGDTIEIQVTGTITLTSGELRINETLTISGPGESALIISGNSSSRVFRISWNFVVISGLTIANGSATNGGGMLDEGYKTTLTDVTFSGNVAEEAGGGIYIVPYDNPSPLTNVTFDGNTAAYGGGLYLEGPGALRLTNVTFSNNTASGDGGGMYNRMCGGPHPAPTLTNVTFSNNTTGGDGGGMYNWQCSLTLTNVTISGNSAERGGGMYNFDSSPALRSTILAGNSAASGPDCIGGINTWGESASVSYSLVGDVTGCTFMAQGYQLLGTAAYPIDSLLAPLADNGGETQTRALRTGSPAIDWIPSGVNGCGTTVATDQRGESRPYPSGGACDIGAYEYYPPTASPTALPDTGFAPGRITRLPEQPAEKAYTDLGGLRLEVPNLDIQVPIVSVPLVGSRWDVSWLGDNVGYLEGSAFPTWQGNTVLTAHVWDAYNRPGLFAELKQLSYGDRVVIHAWGWEYLYEVRENKLISPDAVDIVMQHRERDWITLFTCEGYRFAEEGYAYRRMVQAVMVEVSADP